MAILTRGEREQIVSDITESMKTYAALEGIYLEFYKKDTDHNIQIIFESKKNEPWISHRNNFNQKTNGYPSMRVIFDLFGNKIYVRTKFKGKIGTKVQGIIMKSNVEFVEGIDDIISNYKKYDLSPSKRYDNQRYSSVHNREHYFEHTLKYNGNLFKKLNQLFIIFLELRNRHEGM